MKTFKYKVQLYVKVWQEVDLKVSAQSKEEADAMMIQLAKDQPLSLDNGNNDIEITDTEYLCDTESLVDNTDMHTVQVYDGNCRRCTIKNALYTNITRNVNTEKNEKPTQF